MPLYRLVIHVFATQILKKTPRYFLCIHLLSEDEYNLQKCCSNFELVKMFSSCGNSVWHKRDPEINSSSATEIY